jgi:hypothetical protein
MRQVGNVEIPQEAFMAVLNKWLKFFFKTEKNKDQTWWCKNRQVLFVKFCVLLKKHYFINQYF